MNALSPDSLDFSDSYVDGDDSARWRSASGHEGSASGSSVLEVAPGYRLPRHTDSAEETIVVVAGVAEVEVGDDRAALPAGGLAVVPKDVPHQVRNAAEETLRFIAVYASADVVTSYEQEVQPDGVRERQTVG
jgi:quercetin dioxygenase-like cupin family protein